MDETEKPRTPVTEPTTGTDDGELVTSPRKRALRPFPALLIAVVAAAIAVGSTVLVLQERFSTGPQVLMAVIALIAFGVSGFGVVQAALAVVETASERRRRDREVTERRQGARARKTKGNS